MSLLSALFGRPRQTRPREMNPGNAAEIMRGLNPNAMIGIEDDHLAIIEDVTDPDGRMYRLEYQTTPDGQHATGFCRFNPWGGTPNAGESSIDGHVFEDGSICMGREHYGGSVDGSPYDLQTVVQRARYWATAFSVFKESGEFPNP